MATATTDDPPQDSPCGDTPWPYSPWFSYPMETSGEFIANKTKMNIRIKSADNGWVVYFTSENGSVTTLVYTKWEDVVDGITPIEHRKVTVAQYTLPTDAQP